MELVAYVFQDSVLFTDTIENNIRMGNTEATTEEVEQAAGTPASMRLSKHCPRDIRQW